MEQNKTNKIELKDRLISFYNTNKIKIYTFIIFLIIMLISIAFIKISNENKNILIGNKYIKAGNQLLENLIKNKSKLNSLAKEILNK